MKIYVTLLFLASFFFAQGQESNNGITFYSNVLQNIDISHPSLNIGIEKSLKNSKSISVGIGRYFHFENSADGYLAFNSFGLNGNVEYKNFKNNKFYVAYGIRTGKVNYQTGSSFYSGEKSNPDTLYYESRYKIKKFVLDFYFKFGKRTNVGKRFYLDSFAGLGVRYKNTEHKRSRPGDILYRGTSAHEFDIHDHPFDILKDFREKEGVAIYPILKLGIIIGLKL